MSIFEKPWAKALLFPIITGFILLLIQQGLISKKDSNIIVFKEGSESLNPSQIDTLKIISLGERNESSIQDNNLSFLAYLEKKPKKFHILYYPIYKYLALKIGNILEKSGFEISYGQNKDRFLWFRKYNDKANILRYSNLIDSTIAKSIASKLHSSIALKQYQFSKNEQYDFLLNIDLRDNNFQEFNFKLLLDDLRKDNFDISLLETIFLYDLKGVKALENIFGDNSENMYLKQKEMIFKMGELLLKDTFTQEIINLYSNILFDKYVKRFGLEIDHSLKVLYFTKLMLVNKFKKINKKSSQNMTYNEKDISLKIKKILEKFYKNEEKFLKQKVDEAILKNSYKGEWDINLITAGKFIVPINKDSVVIYKIEKDFYIDCFEVSPKDIRKFAKDNGFKKYNFWTSKGKRWLKSNFDELYSEFCLSDEKVKKIIKDLKLKRPNIDSILIRNLSHDEFFPDYGIDDIDWFLANAYAKSCNKRLPTRLEYIRAATGMYGRVYTYGDILTENAYLDPQMVFMSKYDPEFVKKSIRNIKYVPDRFYNHFPVGKLKKYFLTDYYLITDISPFGVYYLQDGYEWVYDDLKKNADIKFGVGDKNNIFIEKEFNIYYSFLAFRCVKYPQKIML